jgi:hypothetical protein
LSTANDPRMAREAAIKIAAEQFSERFSRGVHAVAALNHPNIFHLYDVGPNSYGQIDQPIIAPRSVDVQWSEQVRAREMIGPVNSPLTGKSTCLFNRFALILR